MASRASQYRASKFEMNRMGIPDDYIDALLDDAYMERLIVATNHINAQRGRKLRRYFRLQAIMLVALVLQALLGLFVTYYKTYGQPDYFFSGTAKLDNVDMVLMLDAAGHNIKVKKKQHDTVKNFTATLMQEMVKIRDSAKQKVVDKINAKKNKNSFRLRDYIPLSQYIAPETEGNEPVSVFGGHLRIATGLFAHEAKILHNFTRDVKIQERLLDKVVDRDYVSNAQWREAIKACNQAVRAAVMHGKTHGREVTEKRFCVIIGDNEAMCKRRHSDRTKRVCGRLPDHCPKDFTGLGSVLENSSEMKGDCTRYVTEQLVNDLRDMDAMDHGTQLLMMLLVKTQQEETVRLRSGNFRQYLTNTTGCTWIEKEENILDRSGNTRVVTTWLRNSTTCNKFIMAHGYDDLRDQTRAIARMLEQHIHEPLSTTNDQKDERYFFFLLLPLNLVFYVIWSKLVQFASIVQTQTQRVMGQKKKMVKVTKTLVEKERRDSTVARFAAQLTELEMAEFSALRAPIEAGERMTLRARLKGGYVRASADGLCDGNGHAFDPSAEWTFECVNPEQGEGGCLQVGHKVRIRNAKGRILRVDAEGATFEGDPADEAAQFMLVHPEGEDMPCHLGDTIRLKSVSTGKYFAVHKDGRCDGNGDAGDLETQLDIDRGGPTIHSGAIITLNSVDGNFVCATPDGHCRAGVDDFRYWLIEHRDCPCSSKAANGGTSDGRDSSDTPDAPEAHRALHRGDIVTLKAFTQSKMVADGRGRIHCGAKPPGEPSGGGLATLHEGGEGEGDGGEPEPAAPLPETQDFMIERVGMGLLSKNDTTIRRGARICLKPVRDMGDRIGDTVHSYVKPKDDGTLIANGSIVDQEISFTVNAGAIQEMVTPLNDAMMKGDVTLSIHPLWNKSDVRRLDALSAAWTHDSDLQHFKGAVVVASNRGAYTVPKAQGEHAWVAVVNEGVDLHKAAAQAKSQGATGLIIRCEEFCSLDNLNMLADAEGKPPVLPTVFVDNNTGKELDEKGLFMIGSEFKKKYLTTAMRAIGRAAAAGNDPSILTDVHAAVGTAMVQRHTEKVAELDMDEDEEPPPEMPTDDQGKYKWKVTSNTYYLWTKTGGGGATRMNVNYGKKLPPMMIQKQRLNPIHNPAGQPEKKLRARGSLVGVTLVDSSDLKNHRLANELSEVLTTTQANEPLEQLSDESDFKIEYTFEEVEIAVGDTPTDLEEDDLINEEGAVISHLAVPLKKFWLVVGAVLLSTSLILSFLLWVLQRKAQVQVPEQENLDDMDMPHPVEALVDAARFAVLPHVRSPPVLGRFLPQASL